MQLPCRRLRRPRRVLRQGPAAFCSAAMASRVSVSGVPGDASPDPATTSVATTVSASIKDSCCPVVPRERSEGFTRLPRCRVRCPCRRCLRAGPWRIRRFAPVAWRIRRRSQSVPDTGASPRRLQNALPFRKRHLDIDSRELRLPRPCRIPADCPVARSGRDGSRPTAPGRPQTASVYRWHQGSTRTECLAALPPKGPRCV